MTLTEIGPSNRVNLGKAVPLSKEKERSRKLRFKSALENCFGSSLFAGKGLYPLAGSELPDTRDTISSGVEGIHDTNTMHNSSTILRINSYSSTPKFWHHRHRWMSISNGYTQKTAFAVQTCLRINFFRPVSAKVQKRRKYGRVEELVSKLKFQRWIL